MKKTKKVTKKTKKEKKTVGLNTTPIPTTPTLSRENTELVAKNEVLFTIEEVNNTSKRMVEVTAKSILDIISRNLVPVKGPMRKNTYFLNISAIAEIKKQYNIA